MTTGSRARSSVIFAKEFREIFRDRRTVMSVVISPLLITPALIALMGSLIQGQQRKAQTTAFAVGTIAPQGASSTLARLTRVPGLRYTAVSQADAESRIRTRALSAVAVLPKNADTMLAAGRTVHVAVMLDQGDENSQRAAGRLSQAIDAIGRQEVVSRLTSRSLPAEFATPFVVAEQPIKSGGSASSLILAVMLPYMITVSAFSGAIYAAFDQVAGEKERGTLETLLVSPASRMDIVLGKFGAVVGVCLISSILSVLGLAIAFGTHLSAFKWLSEGGIAIRPMAGVAVLLVMLPLAVLFAGLLLVISTFARNQKEAQTYLAPLFVVVLMPAMASMFIGTDAPRALALVPVLNVAIIMKQALSGSWDTAFIGLAVLTSAAYAALALAAATRLFQKESVLIKA